MSKRLLVLVLLAAPVTSCGLVPSTPEAGASCMREIEVLRTLDICSSVYATADVYDESKNPDACIGWSAEKMALSSLNSLAASADYNLRNECRSSFSGAYRILTANDVLNTINNKCADRAAVRKFSECLSQWSR